MMKRLQSRLIAAFLGVVLLTMIPLSLFHYYSIDSWFQDSRDKMIEEAREEMFAEYSKNLKTLDKIFFPAVKAFNESIQDNPSTIANFKKSETPDDLDQHKLFFQIRYSESKLNPNYNFPGLQLEVVPLSLYEKMREWSENNHKIEDKQNGIIYYYAMHGIVKGFHAKNMEVIGGLLISIPLVRKTNDETNYELWLGINNRLQGDTRVIGSNPFLLKDVLSADDYNTLYTQKNEIEVHSLSVPWMKDGEPFQAWLKPVVNQDGDLSAIIMIGSKIFNAWDVVGSTILNSTVMVALVMILLAVLISRSISKPMYELVDVANKMSQGDFSAQIAVKGTTEQQVLRSTFNQLADRITLQLNQLQQQTNRLEISNRELENTQRFLQNILVNIHTGVLSVDRNGKITLINQVCREILHIDSCEGKPYSEVLESSIFVQLIAHSLKRCICIYQQELLYESQYLQESIPLQVSTVPMLQQGEFSGLVITIHDLSTLRKLEAEVRRHDRLVSLGRMAGGLAHEIRNPLGIIRGSAEILNKRFGNDPKEEGLSEFIMDEVTRLSRVLSDFLLFARPPAPNMEPVDAQDLLKDITPYVQQSDAFDIHFQIAPDTPMLYLDRQLCKQAFLNLILNAQDAMPDGGTITIKVRPLRTHEVLIEIVDEGEGIPEEIMDRVFDPFVTSKDKGTGLGLSLVHQIVSNQEGKIEVDSRPGKGTCFRIIFPAYRKPAAQVDRFDLQTV